MTQDGNVYKFGESGTGAVCIFSEKMYQLTLLKPPDIHGEVEETAIPKVIPELVLERVLMGQRVIAVSCGHQHSVVITQGRFNNSSSINLISKGGRLWSWGCGQNGRLGHGSTMDLKSPKLCIALLDYHIRAIGCGGAHTVAVASPSRVYTWVIM